MRDDAGSTVIEMGDLNTPWCIRVAVTLGLAEHISSGVHELSRLAELTECDTEGLRRVIRRLEKDGLFVEPAPDEFELTELGRGLLDERVRVRMSLNGIGDRYARVWNGLLRSVQSGSSSYHHTFGLPFWRDLDRNSELADSYEQLMGPVGHGVPDMKFEISGGWDEIKNVMLLGGETGAKLTKLLQLHPHLHGTLLDLPRAIERSKQIVAGSGVADRFSTVAQSYFDPLPDGFDLYLMYGTLRAWPDALCVRLLTRCADAARRDQGRVVVVDGPTPKQAPAARGDQYGSLLELMIGGKGARTRTLEEIRALTDKAGLVVSRVGEAIDMALVVECRVAD